MTSREVKFMDRDADVESKGVHYLIPVPAFAMYLVARSHSVDLVDLDSSSILHTFETEPMQPRTLRHIPVSRAQQTGLASLTLAYINSETGDLVAHTYLADDESDIVYSYCPTESRNGHHRPWHAPRQITRHVENPGKWEALSSGSIVGVRRKRQPSANGDAVSKHAANGINEPWEAWVINHLENSGDFETRTLDCPPQEPVLGLGKHCLDQLMISQLGPMVKLGVMSVAVGVGNIIKLVSVGHEYFDKDRDRLGPVGDMRNLMVRRRKALASARRAAY